jgi:hypothetical protein
MNGAELATEFSQASLNLTLEHTELLQELGVAPLLIAVCRLVGVARIIPARENPKLFIPHPEGSWSFLTPVRVAQAWGPYAADPWAAVRFGEIIDIVAWGPEDLSRYSMRTGHSTWLGCAPLAAFDPFPVEVRDTVLDWLRADGEGLVCLTRDPNEVAQLIYTLSDAGMKCVEEKNARRLKDLKHIDESGRVPKVTYLADRRNRGRGRDGGRRR